MGKRPNASRPPARSTPRPASIVLQKATLARRYPTSTTSASRTELIWHGALTPTGFSDTYEVVISHQLEGTKPLVYVARPRLKLVEGLRLPHVFSLNTLCLYYGTREWNGSMLIANTLLPWTAEWLVYYEVWLTTGGEWLGAGIHDEVPAHARSEKAEAKSKRSADYIRRKTDRLERTLRASYGQDSDLGELTYNARLSPAK